MWKEITEFCKDHDIAVQLPKRKRAVTLLATLTDLFVPTTLGQRVHVEEATNAHETPMTVTQPQKKSAISSCTFLFWMLKLQS